ncbi:carboxypeptidase C, partial [Coemansia sp. RSA 451]
MLFIDQPIGTGFSYGTPVGNSAAAANDFVEMLQMFYESFPEYHTSELHVFGESFAGHY